MRRFIICDRCSFVVYFFPDPGTSALTRPVPLKKGVFSWLFGRKRDKTAKYLAASHTSGDESTNNKTKKRGFSLFGVFGARKEAEAEIDDSLEMWASAQCFYTYNVLSRQSRMQLVLRCSRLEALDGERTNYMLFKTKPKYLNTYYGLKKLLTKDCAKLVVPPVSMKDLASRPFLEVQALFTSQVKICRKLDDLEHLLYNKISKYDNFLPFITCAPVFTRDLNELDSSLLNAERLIMNLANEDALLHHLERKKARLNAGGGVDEKAEKIPDQAAKGGQGGKSQFSYDSVSSAQPSTATALSTVTQVTQNQQAAEEVAVGKMTLSLSQCLDGSNYLLHAQQGSRDMLETYLAQDECMMVWHLPVVPSQNIQVLFYL